MLSEVLLMPVDFAMITLGQAHISTVAASVRLAVNLSVTLGLVYLFDGVGMGYGLLFANSLALAWMWVAFAREATGPVGFEQQSYCETVAQ